MSRPPQDQPATDEAPDDLRREYRRASEVDESRPSDSVRAAILQHAHRVAGRPATAATATKAESVSVPGVDIRAPAANDSRWSLRAVAGLAAVGLAGVLGVMLYRGNPDPQPVPTASLESAAPQLADKGTAPPPIAPMQAAPVPESRASSERRVAVEAASPQAAAEQSEPDRPPSAEADAEVAAAVSAPSAAAPLPEAPSTPDQVTVDTARREAVSPDAAGAGLAREKAALASDAVAPLVIPPVATIVGRYFAQALESDEAGQQYWVLLSRDGRVLRSGQRSAGDDADLVAFVESSFAGVRAGEVQRREFVNQRGRTLSIVYVYLADGSPSP